MDEIVYFFMKAMVCMLSLTVIVFLASLIVGMYKTIRRM